MFDGSSTRQARIPEYLTLHALGGTRQRKYVCALKKYQPMSIGVSSFGLQEGFQYCDLPNPENIFFEPTPKIVKFYSKMDLGLF